MTATIISLLSVTLAFAGLLVWVFWPGQKQRLETFGEIPFLDDGHDDDPAAEESNR
jgi:cbb3-type cytochrome oxidase subunit 3